jgi:hypothetical protein
MRHVHDRASAWCAHAVHVIHSQMNIGYGNWCMEGISPDDLVESTPSVYSATRCASASVPVLRSVTVFLPRSISANQKDLLSLGVHLI